MPPAIEAWNAASARPATQRGADSCTPMLNSAIAIIHTAPPITSAAAVTTGELAERDHGDRHRHHRGAAAHRGLGAEPLAHLADAERAEHRAHAEGAEHQPVGLRAAAQQVARHQRHQRQHRAAGDAGDQRADQHDADRGRIGDVAHAGDDGAVEFFTRQSGRFADPLPQKQHDQQRQIEQRVGGKRRDRARGGDDDAADRRAETARDVVADAVQRHRRGQRLPPAPARSPTTARPGRTAPCRSPPRSRTPAACPG